MNPFVNPNKRTISLPPGCKDLIDVLQLSSATRTPADQGPPIIQPDRFEARGLAQLGRYLTKLLVSNRLYTMLHIASVDGRMRVAFYRFGEEFSVYPLMGTEGEERAIEQFFAERAIEASVDFLVGQPGMSTRVLGFPLPNNVFKVTELTTALLRSVFELDDEAGLEFTYIEPPAR